MCLLMIVSINFFVVLESGSSGVQTILETNPQPLPKGGKSFSTPHLKMIVENRVSAGLKLVKKTVAES